MFKDGFIPVNSENKAVAFCNSLDKDFRRYHQRIKNDDNYIETLEAIHLLNKEGWKIVGVNEHRNSNNITTDHAIKLINPDFTLRDDKRGGIEAESNIILTNSTNGSDPLSMNLGVLRLICSNGLVARDTEFETSLKHDGSGLQKLMQAINGINKAVYKNLGRFTNMKEKMLTKAEMEALATEALKIRFNIEEMQHIDALQLLTAHRPEDEGNSLWLTYNRIQENLTKSGMLFTKRGERIDGVDNMFADITVNERLFELAETF